ncbi:MAG: 4Fe-4S dicluster domain-containing protein [Anaerolineae bacterium]
MTSSDIFNLTEAKRDPDFADQLTSEGGLLRRCVQCGTCTASCPAAPAMDLSPRRMWRMVQLGLSEEVLQSKAMWLCSLCYQCQVRCPRGIPLTDTITRLKERAVKEGAAKWPKSTLFYEIFNGVVRRYGRMREMEFMARYLLIADPLGAVNYAGLGLTLLARGKVHPEVPKLGGRGRLARLYERVAELEARP